MPLASMSNATSICGTPRGAGGRPTSWKRPSVRLSRAIGRSPCSTCTSTLVWLSVAVEKISLFRVGIVVFRGDQRRHHAAERLDAKCTPQGPHELAVATFNMENLDPGDGAKFAQFALQIVNNLRSPDIIAVQEIEDNNGPTNDSTVDASTTFNTLITAIATAGGPPYSFRQIDPVDDSDGGEPGGNIRVGFLFRTDRDLVFLDQPGGGPTVATTVVNNGGVPELSSSPGRIDPANLAFTGSRKPLVSEFVFNGTNVFVIGNHFNSKGGDSAAFWTLPASNSRARKRSGPSRRRSLTILSTASSPSTRMRILLSLEISTISSFRIR